MTFPSATWTLWLRFFRVGTVEPTKLLVEVDVVVDGDSGGSGVGSGALDHKWSSTRARSTPTSSLSTDTPVSGSLNVRPYARGPSLNEVVDGVVSTGTST